MKIVAILLLSLLFFNCSSKRSNINGKYSWDGGYDVFECITINSDSTFVFDWYAGLAGTGKTMGKWDVDGKHIILNSSIQPFEKPEYILLNELQKPNDSIEVKIVDKYGPLQGAICVTFSGNDFIEGKFTNSFGIVKFQKHKFEKIKISFIGYSDILYFIKSSNHNYYEFEIIEKKDYYHYFVNEKWKIKKNRLYSKRIKLIKSLEKNYYEKNYKER